MNANKKLTKLKVDNLEDVTLSDYIKDFCIENGLMYTELGQLTGMSVNSIYGYVYYNNAPMNKNYKKLADIMGLTVHEIRKLKTNRTK